MSLLVPRLRRLAGLVAAIATLVSPGVPAIAAAREPAAAVHVIRAEERAAVAPRRVRPRGRRPEPQRREGPSGLRGPGGTRRFLLFRSLLR